MDEAYTRIPRDKYIGYADVTTIILIINIYTVDAIITQRGLEEEDRQIKEEFDPNHPIEALVYQI